MKLNWGNFLLLFFILYIGLLIRIVIKSFSVDHALVVENYYEFDLKYQEKINKMNNRSLLDHDLEISLDHKSKKLKLDFGKRTEINEAVVSFYRASNKSADTDKKLSNINESIMIGVETLSTGLWKVKVEWKDSKRMYYKEQDLYI